MYSCQLCHFDLLLIFHSKRCGIHSKIIYPHWLAVKLKDFLRAANCPYAHQKLTPYYLKVSLQVSNYLISCLLKEYVVQYLSVARNMWT